MVDIGSIFQAGASTFDTAVNWLMYGQEKSILDAYRTEDLALANVLRKDQLGRDKLATQFQNRQADLQEDAFDFGKTKWGEEFKFTKQQYKEQSKRQKEIDKADAKQRAYAMKEHGLDKLNGEIIQAANKDKNLKDTLLTRYGV
jgi:hypothetical protein